MVFYWVEAGRVLVFSIATRQVEADRQLGCICRGDVMTTTPTLITTSTITITTTVQHAC
jgi:hypothetical protein